MNMGRVQHRFTGSIPWSTRLRSQDRAVVPFEVQARALLPLSGKNHMLCSSVLRESTRERAKTMR